MFNHMRGVVRWDLNVLVDRVEQAAGLVIREQQLTEFRRSINAHALEKYEGDVFVKKIPVDLEIRLSDLKSHFLEELKLLEPHGAGNPRPVFCTSPLQLKSAPARPS